MLASPYSRSKLIEMMEGCQAYSLGTAEAMQEFQSMLSFDTWDTLEAFKDKACIFYEATPVIFHGLVLLYISICFKFNSHNQNTSDAIVFDLHCKSNGVNLVCFSESEFETLHRWIGWLVSRNESRFDYSPTEMLSVYTNVLNAQSRLIDKTS